MSDLHSEQPSTLGGSLGGKLTRLVSDAQVYTRQKMAPHQNQLIQKALADFTNHVSDEIRGIMGPLWKEFADAEETPEHLRPLFKALETERGQAFAWLAGSIVGGSMSVGLGGILNNMLAPVVQKILSGDPNLQLTPNDAANLVAQGHWTAEHGYQEAGRSGVDRERFAALAQLASNHPATGEILELARRGDITDDRARAMMRTIGIGTDDANLLLRLQSIHISPPDVAAMVNRDIVTRDQGRAIAAKGGISTQDFDRLTLLGGDPLPAQDLGVAYRRGIINRDRFEKGIVQGPLRKEWFDVLEALMISRMSTVDAADAVNQGYMPVTEARRIARENGLDPDDFEMLVRMAGQPPGVEFAQEALNRGVITKAQFDKMFKESRIKNEYLPLLYDMRIRLIPQETARLLYRNGVYSRAQALDTLLKHGFSQEDASALLELEETRGDDNTRELTRAQIIDLYESGLFTMAETVELLLGMGYTERDSQAMVYLADTRNFQKFLNSAITRVRSSFLSGKIDSSEASAQLDRLGVKVDQRDMLLNIWETDRLTISKTLTASQIRQAYTKEFISFEEAVKRLTDQGYAQDDAELFLQLTA
jgi:hypothetical protein